MQKAARVSPTRLRTSLLNTRREQGCLLERDPVGRDRFEVVSRPVSSCPGEEESRHTTLKRRAVPSQEEDEREDHIPPETRHSVSI